jgi:hypothetical protein
MLTIGLKSWIVASGWFWTFVRRAGNTVKVDGDEPNEHINFAPLTTCKGIFAPFLIPIRRQRYHDGHPCGIHPAPADDGSDAIEAAARRSGPAVQQTHRVVMQSHSRLAAKSR